MWDKKSVLQEKSKRNERILTDKEKEDFARLEDN